MKIYLFTASIQSDGVTDLARRLSDALPTLRKLGTLEELKAAVKSDVPTNDEPVYIIYPIDTASYSLDSVISIAEQNNVGIFYIFVSKDISASDYKRLIRSGSADWAALSSAPQEILEIISRRSSVQQASTETNEGNLAITAFVPSSGGVGNTTLALETAVQLKLDKATCGRSVCLLDLNIQSSNVCDYLDIEPRLRIEEIASDPGRLDAQLFDQFVSHHSSGLNVLAGPRNKNMSQDLSIAALEVLFRMISKRYDLLMIDLPPTWFGWTSQVISLCDLAVVTGFNTVPGLRQIAETLDAVRGIEPPPRQVVVGLNRCEAQLFGKIAGGVHVKKVLRDEKLFYVRDEPAATNYSLNTGVPVAIASRSSKISKDIRAFAALFALVAPGGQALSAI